MLTLIIASSISFSVIYSFSFLAARSAASFKTFSRSAPANPAVFLATTSKDISSDNFLFLLCTLSISSLAFASGIDTTICLSNLPARSSAESSTSGLFVAASTITPSFEPNPSISTSNWFNVCSLSSCP